MQDAGAGVPPAGSRRIVVQAISGERFEADVPCGTSLKNVAADFFKDQEWPTTDARGGGQRAVIELVDPANPGNTKRLNADEDVCVALGDGDTVRIFPEAIAGGVDQRAHQIALVSDHNELEALCERNSRISFKANRSYAPNVYTVTFRYLSFVELPPGQQQPRTADTHNVEITLGAAYPREAPFVRWLTPIFHPNIDRESGAVCLGVLRERYLPGLGLARLVRMLAEMVQWRNFDAFHPFNPVAAEWAANVKNWERIGAIGGHPFQGPIGALLEEFQRLGQPPITFRRLT
jgi:ubiquitin-protein ligase